MTRIAEQRRTQPTSLKLGAVSGVIHYVAFSRIVLPLSLAIAVIGGSAYISHVHGKLRANEADHQAQLAKLHDEWSAKLADAENRIRELEAEALAQQRPGSNEPGEGTPPEGTLAMGSAGAARAVTQTGGRVSDFQTLMEDPEFARMWNAQQRARLDGRYADLFRLLKLNPAELDRLKNLLVEKRNSFRDVMAAARSEGINMRENRDELRNLQAQAQAEIDASIRDLLGPAGFNQFQQYEQTLPQRNLVTQLDQRLSYSAAPLNDQQSEQLVKILAETSSNRSGRRGPEITDDAVNRAAAVLTPAQKAALQQLQTEQQMQRELQDRSRRQRTVPAAPAR